MMSDNNIREARRKAVAIRYNQEKDAAPHIVAKGSGYLAERIMELALENNILIHEDRDLVTLLSKLDVDTDIPENLYRAVAEILVFVYQLNQKFAG
jgi:flagellar biosynthesis protein